MHFLLLSALDDRMTFGSPGWFWALLLLLPLGWLFFDAARRRAALLARILAPRLQESLAGQVSHFKRTLRIACLLGAIVLSIVALAKPRYGTLDQEIRAKGRDVIIAIDTSRSMLSTDTAPTRLGRAKLISQDLLNLLRGDRVGLIAFAGSAFLQAPLTLDKGAVLISIEDLDTNTIPKGGTDIAAAIRLAIQAFGKGETMSRALVLMTDGEELDESGVEAAKEAAAAGIRIYTIGFGSTSGSLIPIKTEDGRNDFVRDENGRPVNSKLDAVRLNEIAQATGGFYLPYGQDAASLIYNKGILPMDEEENGTLTSRKPIERYGWPAASALVLLMFWTVLGEGRRRSGVVVAVIALLMLTSPRSLQAEPAGINAYQAGDYETALKDFEKKLQSGANVPEIKFDAGAAAYKAGDYKKAADYFAGAMTSSNPKIRDAATYNLANSLVRSGEAVEEKEGKLSDWKNALQHYETVLKDHPANAQAKENRDIVKKLIEDLNKPQPPKKQDKKNNKDQNDKNKDKDKDKSKSDQSQGGGNGKDEKKDQNKDQQKNDQSQGGGNVNDQQKNQDQKNNDQNKPQDSKGSQGGNQDQQNKQQNQQQGNQGQPTPTPTPDQGKGSGAQNQSGQQQNGQQSQQQTGRQQQGQGGQPTPTPGQKKTGAIGGGQQGQNKEQQGANTQPAETQEGKDGKMSPNLARALLRSVQDEEAHQLSNQQNRAVEQPLHDW